MITDFAVARFLFTAADQHDTARMKFLVALAAPQRKEFDLKGSYVPLLKIAYGVAADILDKGSGYINDLCELHVRERAVYLGTVWHERGRPENPLSVAALRAIGRNSYVRGIYDLSLDWRNEELDDRLHKIRHALTHRYLPIHLQPSGEGAKGTMEFTAEEMRALTLFALKTARAMILHAAGATEMEIRFRAESASRVTQKPLGRPAASPASTSSDH